MQIKKSNKREKKRTELSQSVARIVMTIIAFIYMLVSYYIGEGFANQGTAILGIALYFPYSILINISIRRYPQVIPWRILMNITMDLAVVSYGFYLGNAYGGLMYPLLLWTIVGNGLRFGVAYLVFAMLVALSFVSIAIISSDYWTQNLVMAISQLIGMIMLPIFYVIVLRELEATNLDLQKQKETAEQANLAKSRFLAAASHDLRQPLQAQALFVADLYGQLHDKEKSTEILGKLDDSIRAMSEQFNALLDISKLDAGVIQPKIKNIRISVLLNLLKDEYARLAEEKGLKLKVRCRDFVVLTDPGLLDSVLRNLVVNAIRYTHSGKVLIGCRSHKNYVSIEVWDTGIGIKKKYMEDIFQEFFQIDNPSRNRDQGLGLGLSVVRRITHLLDCRMYVKSIEGKGSCFSIDVPLGDSDALCSDNEIKIIDQVHVLDGTCVVVIDDELSIQDAMQGLLCSWGCDVLVAQTGEEALFQVSESDITPDIIIADYRILGDMTGVQAVEEIRKFLNHKTPAILITGDIETKKLQDVKESNIPFLHKPIQAGKLRTLMNHLLSNDSSHL